MRYQYAIAGLFLVASGTFIYFYSFSPSKKESATVVTPPPENLEVDPHSYQGRPPDPKKAPDYSGIQVSEVTVFDIKLGSGPSAKTGSQVKVSYGMWVYDPRRIKNRGLEIAGTKNALEAEIKIGDGDILPGFEKGIIGAQAGGERTVLIPAAQAYGKKGTKEVPPNSILQVELKILSIK